MALRTGAHRGELLALLWDRVDFDDASVLLTHTKGKRDRRVPFNPDVADVLRRLQAMTLQDGGPFVGMADNLGRQWGRIRKEADLTDVAFHDLRRTCATRLLRAGTPVTVVQESLGHADIKTTTTYYSRVNDQDVRDGIARLTEAAG